MFKYKSDFVKGFYQGQEEVSKECAVRMLKIRDFFDDAKISSYTGLFS